MITTAMLAHEAGFLAEVVKLHEKKIEAAYEAAEAAEEAFAGVFGCFPWEAPEYATGWTAAMKKVEALKEEPGYYWTESRIHDLSLLIGASGETLSLRTGMYGWKFCGPMPPPHATVSPWIAKTVGAPYVGAAMAA